MEPVGHKFNRFIVVLARPAESGNIGMACRAMKTMGLTRLRITGTFGFDPNLVKRFAVHASDIFETAEFFQDLPSALSDVTISAGITRRRGRKRKAYSIASEEFARFVWARPEGTVALVFGNEKHGLSEEELAYCEMAVHIPSSSLFPSLNLAQAVQVTAYDIFRTCPDLLVASYTPLERGQLEPIIDSVCDILDEAGFFSKRPREQSGEFLRGMLLRAAVSASEANIFLQMIRKVGRLAKKKTEAGSNQ